MNKSAQFTPGPWREYHTHGNWEMYGSNGQLLFRIKDGVIPMLNDTALIAAAPAMYEAGQLSLDVLMRVATELERTGNEELRSIVRSAIIEQKTALAQAEGRQA